MKLIHVNAAIVTCALFVQPCSVLAANTSGQAPGTVVSDSSSGAAAWSSPGNATASDSTYASADGTNQTELLKATDFGFAIPSDATVEGVLVEIETNAASGNSSTEQTIKLVKGDTVTGDNKSTGATWSFTADNADVNRTYGGASDLWGVSLTAADVNATTFGVVAQVGNGCTTICGSANVLVDYIQMTVYYTEAATASSGGGAGGAAVRRRIRNAGKIMSIANNIHSSAEEEFDGVNVGTFFFDTTPPALTDVGIFIPEESPSEPKPLLSPEEYRRQRGFFVQENRSRLDRRISRYLSNSQSVKHAAPVFQRQNICNRLQSRSLAPRVLHRANARLQKTFGFVCN